MDTKEEKKERKQSYFARLKKKKQAKQNAELAARAHPGRDDANAAFSEPDKSRVAGGEDCVTDERKKKNSRLKEIRRPELKRCYSMVPHSLPSACSFRARGDSVSLLHCHRGHLLSRKPPLCGSCVLS